MFVYIGYDGTWQGLSTNGILSSQIDGSDLPRSSEGLYKTLLLERTMEPMLAINFLSIVLRRTSIETIPERLKEEEVWSLRALMSPKNSKIVNFPVTLISIQSKPVSDKKKKIKCLGNALKLYKKYWNSKMQSFKDYVKKMGNKIGEKI